MKTKILWILLTIVMYACTDLDKSFITADDDVLQFIMPETDTIDPFAQSLISGAIEVGDSTKKWPDWTNIEPEITLKVSQGVVVKPPYTDPEGASNSLTAQTAAQRLLFEWKLARPITENTLTIAATMDITTGGEITATKVIHLSHLSPSFADLILDNDSLAFSEQDTVNASVTLSNINGPVGSIIPVEIKQASDNSATVSFIRDGAYAIDGLYEFGIINASSEQGSVRVWVEAEGVEADARVVHFK